MLTFLDRTQILFRQVFWVHHRVGGAIVPSLIPLRAGLIWHIRYASHVWALPLKEAHQYSISNSVTHSKHSLVPRPSLAPVFDHLQYAKTEPEGLVNLTMWSVAWLTSQILEMETYSHLYLELQRSWRNKTSSNQETSPTSRTLPSLKQNHSRMVPLQALQIQERLLFCYTS